MFLWIKETSGYFIRGVSSTILNSEDYFTVNSLTSLAIFKSMRTFTNALINHPEHDQPRQELEKQRAALLEKLAELDLQLADLRAELQAFERRYYQVVGHLYVELDEIQARLAVARARYAPEQPELWTAARQARHQAQQTAREYHEASADLPEKEPPPPPDPDLKKLFRTIASQIHPDRAEDEKSRQLRTELMAKLNAAYAQRDRQAMENILRHWRESPASVTGEDTAADLERLRRQIVQLQQRAAEREHELADLYDSERFRLLQQVSMAQDQGRDLLAELAEDIVRRIRIARAALDETG